MKKPEIHILVCNSYRIGAEPKGGCNKKHAPEIINYLMEEAPAHGFDAVISSTGCLNVCSQSIVIVVHPHNFWYGAINEEAVDEILEALEEGKAVEKYLICD